ncbi:MAG: HAD-IA family hydrolase [Roseiflexus sp.]|nr:HAD-IA family hydrolase [Roseiflexus sp.]MCS7289371.1 HAD-IA family hydrolase [Roseiflexus sp.]MDW8145106.1 HAD-IA family hydrolase [Roseiflexaceae bacterium]MDW8233312.1 HAD-IA family hydrolase [Roseiflexaceae bacterium]
MTREYDVITFDCYGTLIDWDAGIRSGFAAAAQRAGVTVDLDAALAAYHAIEPQVEASEYRPYRQVLAETAQRAAATLGWPMDDDTAQFFAATLPQWPPFADTNPALEQLYAAGYRLGILSNVDDDLLAATIRHFTAPIDLIVTAQQVGSYKPNIGHFVAARERIGGLRWLHVAQSHFHDVVPAARMGLPVVWVNRKREPLPPDGPAPLAEVPDLRAFVEWIGGRRAENQEPATEN